MSKVQIKSIFEQIAKEVFSMRDVNAAKQFITEFVNSKDINDQDKRTIISNVETCKHINGLQKYICNSLLKYEGMGVSR